MKMYFVEIIRYGFDDLGVHPFNFYRNKRDIFNTMVGYNRYRGGKYPAFYLSECFLTKVSIGDSYDYRGTRYSGKIKFWDLWEKSMCRDKELICKYGDFFVVFAEVEKEKYLIEGRNCIRAL